MSVATTMPLVTSADRLSVTVFFAIVAHAIFVLGITFAPTHKPRPMTSTLDVTLVQQRSEKAPEEADYLAQANQDGGGEQTERARPASPLPAPFTSTEAKLAVASPPAAAPQTVAEGPALKASPKGPEKPAPKPVLAQDKAPASKKALTRPTERPAPRTKPDLEKQPSPVAQSAPTKTVSAAVLINRSLAMASLNAEIDQKLKAYAKRPRRKWITARTREYKYASYMEAWRNKVERIGNLNYPDEARRKKLSGHLLLDVAINANGTINEITLRRSSGYRVLDDAAVRIVKLAAPFAPLPKSIRNETDILHIERTWKFLRSNRLASR